MIRLTRPVVRFVLAIACLGVATLSHAAGLRQAFLVQNSGWMEPFYEDPASPFKKLVRDLAVAAAGEQEIVLAAFNQADASHPSPEWVYRGPGNHAGLQPAIDKLALARKASGAYADTDFREALLGAIKVGLEGKEGIVWILTNNKNSPNNSAQTREKNREFYELLHTNDVISRIAAFPLRMPVKGRTYSANGLMVYALAYGESAGAQLEQVLASPSVQAMFSEGAVRLKPLTQGAVAFLPEAVVDAPGVGASLAGDRRTLVLDLEADTSPTTAVVVGRFENRFYPYEIISARTSIALEMPQGGLKADLSSTQIGGIVPGGKSEPVRLSLQLPALPSAWSPTVLFSSGYQVTGTVRIRLDDQRLNISDNFTARMAELFPGDALPEVFTPPAQANTSLTELPLIVRVHHPIGPLLMLCILVGCLLLALLILWFFVTSKRYYTVSVDGIPYKVALKPFGSANVLRSDGSKAATLRRGLGKPSIVWRDPNTAVSLR